MKKLFVEKNESIASIVERILAEPSDEITLIVPRNAKIRESASNFHLLKREIDAARKELEIESVDEVTLGMAQANDIGAVHPLFSGGKRALSDILPRSEVEQKLAIKNAPHPMKRQSNPEMADGELLPSDEDQEFYEQLYERRPENPKSRRSTVKVDLEDDVLEEIEEEPRGYERIDTDETPWYGRIKTWVGIFFVLVVLGGGVWGYDTYLGRAAVAIDFKQTPFTWNGTFSASTSSSAVDLAANKLPAELFSEDKNVLVLVPATGKGNGSQKASGQITIFNSYSDRPQMLVATTRFQTPEGKIYRLDKTVRVPGATMKNGKAAVPGSIDASVTADKAGADYNTGPVDKLMIPGFAGKPQFAAIYGTLKNGASGAGANGTPIPTDADIQAGQQKATDLVKKALHDQLSSVVPPGIKIIDGASNIQVTKITVNKNVDANGNFGVFGEGIIQAIGFSESDLNGVLQVTADKNKTHVFKTLDLSYSNVNADYAHGALTFALAAQGSLIPAFDDEAFKGSILGKPISTVNKALLALPEFGDGKITLTPRWLQSIPDRASRVTVTVQ